MIALFSALAAMLLLQPEIVIDDFESVAGWKAVPSDDVSLSIGQDMGARGKSMRLDFDFHGHGGYAVIHRDVKLALPANYEFSFSIRGEAPVNTLEFKLIDPSGDNVWWSNQPEFFFPAEWRKITRKKRHITFAWGPLGGGDMKEVAGIEIAITAGTGGKGTVWIDDLELTPLEPQGVYNLQPRMTLGGESGNKRLDIDFLKRREFGGLVIDWEKNLRPASYAVSTSVNGTAFSKVYTVGRSMASRDYLYLPESDARYIRLAFSPQPKFKTSAPYVIGLKEISVKPLAWSATKNDFFSAVARDAPSGSYPRYFSGKQSYWTVIGVSGDTREALIDEQGTLESGKGQFSVEPFLFTDGRLITWNDASRIAGSVGNDLPIPYVTWKTPRLEMTVTAFAAGAPDSSVLYARYRIRNPAFLPQRATLYLAIRPFQVNPPWQFLNTQGGVATIDSISYDGRRVQVNADRTVIPLTPASRFGAMSFDEGNIVDMLRLSRLPSATSVQDQLGRVSGALAWDVRLRPNSDSTIDVAIPLHAAGPSCLRGSSFEQCGRNWVRSQLEAVESGWREKLGRVDIRLPSSASRFTSTIRANLAYILINRDGPAIQPGSRSYERSWIRDGALTSAALLRLGQYGEVRDFIDWYARFQFENGKIPCCVDARGADPVPENDSHGEFIYLIAEYFRHTGDRQLLERTWPNVSRAFAFMDSLRLSLTTGEYRSGDKRVFFGLMPQSISHEGYSAKPMHSYWDDFFALRGFKDAAEIAKTLGKPEATRYAAVRDDFRKDFYASIRLSMVQHRIDYIPGAAELGDFDATSTTIAVNPADELAYLPQPALTRTFLKYYENFLTRRDDANSWEIYTPYEWRVVGTFLRMGYRSEPHEIADFLFQYQRPKAWHQWAEVVWRDSLTPNFIGDMPHTWVGSDFIRSTLDMFAYERESDSSLVIGAGIPEKWVREENGVSLHGLSTHYGPLSYDMRAAGEELEIRIETGIRIPSGGLVVRSPSDRPLRQVLVNGAGVTPGAGEVVVRSLPAVITFRY
ncbi:MAG: hypothetical protein Q7S20_08515 [Gemmatimonadaceae bacterium]|nr:hypothetical protein [Gemmatimonadaceae bacterium]